jgi:hypothetical protein
MTSALLFNLATTTRLVSLFWPITPLGILLMLPDPPCLAGLRPVGRCAGGYNTIVRTVGKLFRGQGQSVSACCFSTGPLPQQTTLQHNEDTNPMLCCLTLQVTLHHQRSYSLPCNLTK